ncbi:MAG: hypothetical protein DI570_10255 [Phenylobacterium zucineum]|nr:MAG: hypothetical protein DI570_10255 [Phenylobacterium zucineum]
MAQACTVVRPRASCSVFSGSQGVGSAQTPRQRLCRVTMASRALGISRPAIHRPAVRARSSPVAAAPTASMASGPVAASVNQARTLSWRDPRNMPARLPGAFKSP